MLYSISVPVLLVVLFFCLLEDYCIRTALRYSFFSFLHIRLSVSSNINSHSSEFLFFLLFSILMAFKPPLSLQSPSSSLPTSGFSSKALASVPSGFIPLFFGDICNLGSHFTVCILGTSSLNSLKSVWSSVMVSST